MLRCGQSLEVPFPVVAENLQNFNEIGGGLQIQNRLGIISEVVESFLHQWNQGRPPARGHFHTGTKSFHSLCKRDTGLEKHGGSLTFQKYPKSPKTSTS